jgi:RiboL-PSP-HEPN
MDAEQNTPRPTLLQQVQANDEFERQMEARLRPYLNRISENIDRAVRLLQLFEHLCEIEAEGRQDILRAAVVFIHAYLEDFLRTLASELLPAVDGNSLQDIPLAGSGSFGRSEKFVLGQLVQHRGKTVDDLLRESVSEYLSRSNYNNTTEIALLLTRLGFKPEEHNERFAEIDQMIQRRHQIVHRADRVDESGTPVLQPIEREQVTAWLAATHGLTASLMTPLMRRLPQLLKTKSRPGA